MRVGEQVKSITFLKNNTGEVMEKLAENRLPFIITQNGEAKVVIQDVQSYEQTQETLALLKILALGNRQIEEGRVQEATTVFENLRGRREV